VREDECGQKLPEVHGTSSDELRKIHTAGLDILAEVGMQVEEPDLRERLGALGAKVHGQIVCLPRDLVLAALRSAPAQYTLDDRRGGSFIIGDGSCHVAAPGHVPNVLDYGTSRPRLPERKDLRAFTALLDAMPDMDLVRAAVVPVSPAGWERSLCTMVDLVSRTTKHILVVPFDFQEFGWWVDLSSRLARPARLDERRIISAFVSTTSPLRITSDDSLILQLCCRERIPIFILSSISVGGTGPVTLAGALAVQHAENLFVAAASQLLNPGIPVCYGTTSSPLDMRSARTSRGGPLHSLLVRASPGLARLCGLPCYCGTFHTDASTSDFQAGTQKASMLVSALTSGASVCGGPGALQAAMLISLEQVLLDMELYRMVRRLQRGFHVSDERLGLPTVGTVGPGGNFLAEEHTVRWMRDEDESFTPGLFASGGGPADARSMLDRAHERVENILNTHQAGVSPAEMEIIEEFAREVRRGLGPM